MLIKAYIDYNFKLTSLQFEGILLTYKKVKNYGRAIMTRIFMWVFFLLISHTLSLFINAEVRFVSKTGNSTPPYTSWTTAADSIQKCINVAAYGDTIFVGEGTYEEYVKVYSGIRLIGAGYDKCIIDSRAFLDTTEHVVELSDNTELNGFKLIVTTPSNTRATAIRVICPQDSGNLPTTIKNNLITDTEYGIRGTQTNIIIEDNIFTNMKSGIIFTPYWKFYDHIVRRNIFHVQNGIGPGVSQNITVNNNIFYLDGQLPTAVRSAGSLKCYNNLMINYGWGNPAIGGYIYPVEIINNTIVGKFYKGLDVYTENHVAKNNIIYNTRIAISTEGAYTSPIIKYNCIWLYEQLYDNEPLDSTNIVADPMFEDIESEKFYLQKFSPCINSGDPSILDKDGSRSDMGLYGGPFGETYTYKDLAPRQPRNLLGNVDSGKITITWLSNSEADFSEYNIYKSTEPNFTISTSNFLQSTIDTFFIEFLKAGTNLYYKITALDSSKNESPPSEELTVTLTGIDEHEIKDKEYQLYQNYPNPFNPSTNISFYLKERSSVRLSIFDTNGEKVAELLNTKKPKGYHEINFSVQEQNKELASGVYVYSLTVTDSKNHFYHTAKKMMLMK